MQTRSLLAALAALLAAGTAGVSAQTHPIVTAPGSVDVIVEVDRPVQPLDGDATALLRIGVRGRDLPARDRAPINLCVVIDRSGSMSGDRIAFAREGAIEALRRLGPDDWFSLVAYDHRVETLVPPQRVEDRRRIEWIIRSLEVGGNTNLHGGVEQGARELRRMTRAGFLNRLVLLSDGQANVGPSTPHALADLGRRLAADGITVSTVGIGLGYNEDLMVALSQASEGNAHFVADASDLPRIFAHEVGTASRIVATDIRVRIELPEGVRIRRTLGRDVVQVPGAQEIEFRDVVAGQTKFAVIEVALPEAARPEVQTLAHAQATFRLPGSSDELQAAGSVAVRRTAQRAEVEAHVNRDVETAYGSLVVAAAREEAVALADQRRNAEAAAALQRSADTLSSMAARSNNSSLRLMAAPVAAAAPSVAADGIDNDERKRYRTDAYQERNQQVSVEPQP